MYGLTERVTMVVLVMLKEKVCVGGVKRRNFVRKSVAFKWNSLFPSNQPQLYKELSCK